MESSRKGKEKEKSIKMRLIPPRITSQWRTSPIPEMEMELGELENVIYVSPESLGIVRRKLQIDGEGPVYVRISQVSKSPRDRASKEVIENGKADAEMGASEDTESDKDTRMDGWLLPWKAIPEGCCVVAGPSKEGWSDWATVRYVPPHHTRTLAHLYRISKGTPAKGRLKGNKSKDESRLDL